MGTSFYSNLSLEQSGGVDPLSDYTQGNYNTTQLPSAAQKANAAGYKLVDWTTLYWSQPQAAAQGASLIKDALAHNRPVAIGIDVYTNFFYVGATTDHYDGVSGGFAGRHAVAVLGYDAYGVRIENSWSSGWGNRGFAWLSWGFVAAHTSEAYSVNGFTAPSAGPAPVLTALSSASGPWTGGTIKLNGSNLTGAAVTFGSVAATSVTVNSAGTEATVGVPSAVTGKVAVAATTTSGGRSNTLDYTYTAGPPTISGVAPASGPSTGGTVVTLTGTNLNTVTGSAYTVLFGTTASTRVIVAADGRSLTAVAPAGSVGPVSVKVVNAGGTSGTAPFAYTWPVAPVITLTAPAVTVAPGAGVALSGAVRQPNGTAYARLAVVLQSRAKGSTAPFVPVATGVTATDGTVAFAVVAAASIEYRLAIVGDVASAPLAITVVPPPTVTALSAVAGPRTGGQTIVVTGTNLAGGTVTLGTAAVKPLSVNAAGTMLTFVTPAHAVGAVGVVVSTATGASRAMTYTYRA